MVNMAIPVNEAVFEREGLARLKALLEEVPFVKDVKVRAQLDDHGWDAEMTVRTAAGGDPLARRMQTPQRAAFVA